MMGRSLLNRHVTGLLLAAAIGACVAILLFPPSMLLGLHRYWDNVTGDRATSLAAYIAYAQDSWRWPLLQTETINAPTGVNIYYSDAIPALAIFGKAFYQITGWVPIYFGPWILFCYVMNASMGYLILRKMGLSVAYSVMCSAFFVLTPIFLWRFLHVTLMGQFTILTAIYCYLMFTRTLSRQGIVAVSSCFGLMVLVHPYLFAMCSAVIFAAVLDSWYRSRISFLTGAIALLGLIAVSAATAYACGLIGTGASLPDSSGFGIYSMNLLSPIWPQHSILSLGNGFLEAVSGQYEGQSYLGAGILFIILFLLFRETPNVISFIRTHPFLIAVCVLLTVYSLSDVIYAGHTKLADIGYSDWPVMDRITSVFRAGGRFFWPVSYLIIISLIYLVYTRNSLKKTVGPMLGAALAIQAVDLIPMYQLVRGEARHRLEILQRPAVQELVKQHSELLIHPAPVLCYGGEGSNTLLGYQLMAAIERKPYNGAYTSRSNVGCEVAQDAFDQDPFHASLTTDPLLVIAKSTISPMRVGYGMPSDVECRETEMVYLCQRGRGTGLLAGIGAPVHVPTLTTGKPEPINAAGGQFLSTGWSGPEGDFRWSIGSETTIFAKMTEEVCNAVLFSADVQPFSHGSYTARKAAISINGSPAHAIELASAERQQVEATIPLAGCTDKLKVEIKFEDPQSPADLGMNTDARKVTWAFRSYALGGAPK